MKFEGLKNLKPSKFCLQISLREITRQMRRKHLCRAETAEQDLCATYTTLMCSRFLKISADLRNMSLLYSPGRCL